MATQGRKILFDPVSIAGIAGDVFNTIKDVLEKIPLLGSLLRGSTPHIDEDTAVSKSNEIAGNFIRLYDALPSEGQEYAAARARDFYEGRYVTFRGWWDNIFQRDRDSWASKGWTANDRELTYHEIAQPAFIFLRMEDATRVQDNFPKWYTDPFASQVMNPLRNFIQEKYHTSLENFVASPPLKTGAPSEANFLGFKLDTSSTWTWLAIGAAVFFGFKFLKKGR